MKTSTIVNCDFVSQWLNPKGGLIYYHKLTMQNGDSGSIGTMEKLPNRIAAGTTVEYELDPTGKIKITNTPPPAPVKQYTAPPAQKTMNNYSKKPEDFLGFVFGYAKDIVCAKITAKEKGLDATAETIAVSRALYDEIKKMLNE